MIPGGDPSRERLPRRGFRLEYLTLGWNAVGIVILGLAAVAARSVSTVVLAVGYHPRHSLAGIIWTALTAAVMFALAAGKARTGQSLDNPVLRTDVPSLRLRPGTGGQVPGVPGAGDLNAGNRERKEHFGVVFTGRAHNCPWSGQASSAGARVPA